MALGMPVGWRDARVAWASLSREVRRDVTTRAARGEPHPDPTVRRVVQRYAASFSIPKTAGIVWLLGFTTPGVAATVAVAVVSEGFRWSALVTLTATTLIPPLFMIRQWKEAQRMGEANRAVAGAR
jgi:hypothetical protein